MRRFFAVPLFVALAYAVFLPSMGGEFIMDDWGYITQNPWITTTSSPLPFWTTFHQPDYWPLSYTFYWIFFHLFGSQPFPYHLVNVLLHAFNALMVYRLAQQFGVHRPLWAGLLFLLHPLHVQAVSWIVQFKTLFSTSFALICMLFYIDFLRTDELRKWALAIVAFVLAVLAKSSVVPLAAVLFVLPRATGKLGKLPSIPYWIPFGVVAAAAAWITLHVNDLNFTDRAAYVFQMPFAERPWLAGQNLLFYLTKFVVPYPLSFIYPLKMPAPDSYVYLGAALAILAGVFVLKPMRNSRIPFLCFVLTLLPVLGFVAIPGMKLSLAMDHWGYFPDVFLVIAAAAMLDAVSVPQVQALSYAFLLPLGVLSWLHAGNFESEETFWQQAEHVNPANAVPKYNLGTVYDKQTKTTEAVRAYEAAVGLDPAHDRAWYNLGRDFFTLGRMADAQKSFTSAIQANKKQTAAYIGMAAVYTRQRQPVQAVNILKEGLLANPGDVSLTNALSAAEASRPGHSGH